MRTIRKLASSGDSPASSDRQIDRRRCARALCWSIVAVSAGVALRLALREPLTGHSPYLTVYPVAMFAAVLGGRWPGLAATAVGHLAADYCFISPPMQFHLTTPSLVSLGMIVGSGLFLGHIGDRLRTSQARLRQEADAARAAEEALRANEERFRVLVAASFEGIAISEDGRLIDVNDRLVEILGYSREELIGTELSRLIAPEDRDSVMSNILAGREAFTEHALIRKDGRRVVVETHGRTVENESRRIRLTAIRDITGRKQAEEALRESEERFRNIADHSPLMVWVTRPDGYCTYLNRHWYEFTGQTEETGLGFGWVDAIHPEDAVRTREAFVQAIGRGGAFRLEYRLRRTDGEYRWCIDAAGPRLGRGGELLGYVGSVIDITDRKQAEALLQHERDTLQAVMDGARNSHLVFLNRAFNFVRVNATYAANCGYTPEEMVGKNHFALYPHPENEAIFARVRDTGEPYEARDRPFTFPDHPERGVTYWDWTLLPVKDAEGFVEGLVFALYETTARKRAEDALRDSEQRFREVFEHTATGIAIIDGSGQFQDCNPAYCHLLGYSRDELLRKNFSELVHPDDAADNMDATRRLWAGELPQFEVENRYLRKDGKPIWVHKLVSALPDERGVPVSVVALVTDVTERRESEAAIRELSQRLSYHVDHSPLAVIEWGPDMRLIRWSGAAERVFGWKAEEVLGRRLQDFRWVHEEDAEEVSEVSSMLQTGADPHRFSLNRNYRKDGSVVYCEWYNSSLLDESGRLRSILSLALDVTDRKVLEQQRESLLSAERAARMDSEKLVRLKDEFLATVSHELRSPLSAIVGWSGLLAKGGIEPARAVSIIQRSASSLAQIVEDLLDVSRITSGKVRLNVEMVNISELLSRAVEAVQFSAEAKSIALNVSFDPELAPIECDPNRIQQIIWNLLSNAVKFTPEGGTVALEVRESRREVTITVRDSGKGFTPEFLPHLFEQFRQEDGGIARKHGGLGLGLSIVRQLVELHGGTVEAHSEGLDQGATFIVRLPRTRGSLSYTGERPWFSRPAAESQAAVDECALAGVQVVVVDDDPSARELLQRVLSDAGATVRAAQNAEQAWALLNESCPNVLISDIGMPDEDGLSFVRRLRQRDDSGGKVPVIAVTALGRAEDRGAALRAGFDEHVGKPFDPGMLCRIIRNLLLSRGDRLTSGAEQNDIASPPAAQAEPRPVSPGAHLLIAEDNSTIREMLKAGLEEQGYRVSATDSIADGVAIARDCPVDLLLSDLRLKDGMGWDLLLQLHGQADPSVPGIVMSGYSDQAYIARSKQAGFDTYLVKPVDTAQLAGEVARLLRRRMNESR